MKSFLLIATLFLCACSEKDSSTANDTDFNPDINSITKDSNAWYKYHYANIHLARDFTGMDADSSPMAKREFLTKLATGNFVALKTRMKNGVPTYQLFKPAGNDPSMRRVVNQLTTYELANTALEGTQLPEFSFTDLEGNRYDKAGSQGKILVLKCWFIGCTACVKEFPELNELVDRYAPNPDIEFVSLASDTGPKLKSFLEKKPFKYAVVPEQDAFMTNKLNITMYPTHIVVDGEGRIVKVVNNVEDLIPFLDKLVK